MVAALNIQANDRFVREQLTEYGRRVIPAPELSKWGYDGQYHNATGNLPFGLQAIQSYEINYVGEAVDYSEQVTEIPTATFGIEGKEIRSSFAILGAKWTYAELETARLASRAGLGPDINIVGAYRYALRKGLQMWMHKRVLFGVPNSRYAGIFTHPEVRVIQRNLSEITNADGTAFDPEKVYNVFSAIASEIRLSTLLTASGSMNALISEGINQALNARFTQTGGTPKAVIRGTDLGSAQIGQFNVVNECDGSIYRRLSGLDHVGSNTAVSADVEDGDQIMVIYSSAANTMRRRFYPISVLPVERNLLEWRTVGICGTTEMEIPEPAYVTVYVFKRGTAKVIPMFGALNEGGIAVAA